MDELVVFTGGGTGGHVFPGLAVAEELHASQVRIAWIGSTRGMERRLLADSRIPFYGIPSGKLRRYFSIRNLTDIARVCAGFCAALCVLRRLRPKVVFSKGGYVSVPVVAAARLLRIPTATHESDADPGLATRINARIAERVLISYESSRDYFPPEVRGKCVTVGNPVRRSLAAGDAGRGRKLLGFTADRPVVFFVGGSLGSAQINRLLAQVLDDLLARASVVHQRGEHPPPRPNGEGYVSFAFIREEFADVLAAADLVVCRAGAGTLWELALMHKPSLLIPLSSTSSRGDQQRNARIFAEHGASRVLDGDSVTAELLFAEVTQLLEHEPERKRMAEAAAGFDAAGAAGRIAAMIQDAVERGGWTS